MKSSKEAEEGEGENISKKINVKLRETDRETKRLFTTVSFQVSLMFSFFKLIISLYASLPHIFCKTRRKRLQFRVDGDSDTFQQPLESCFV